ncbi:MAG TPA: hypothetical protein VFE51_19470 [Verrucomicrobiae bacterium]|nr:hypothetical protein [Verrucomicrobiae bacterium]
MRKVCFLLLLMAAGCATPYRPMRSGAGFADEQTAPDQFWVSFQGNGHNTSEQVNDFALLRSAQVTLEHGFRYFAVLAVTNTSSARPYVARQQFYSDYPPNLGLPPPTPGGIDPYRFGYIVEYDQPEIYFRPGTRFVIQCFKTEPDHPFTYAAAALEQSLKRKYKLR